MKKQALGKGLGALLGTMEACPGERVANIDVGLIEPNRYQPRQSFDNARLEELAASIRSGGIIQPLVVRRNGKSYELISGERRLQAAKLAGLGTVPVILRDVGHDQLLVLALVENLQRVNLNTVDEALALSKLVDEFGLNHQEIAKTLGKSRTHVSNMLRILSLPKDVLTLLTNGRLSFGHAKVLAGIDDPEDVCALARLAASESWSVRYLEQVCSSNPHDTNKNTVPRGTSKDQPTSAKHRKIQKDLAKFWGAPVRIHTGRRKGRIEIEFKSTDEFDDLISRIFAKI